MLKVVGASWLQTKISSYILGVLGVLAILALFVGQIERSQDDGNYAATVFYSEKTGYRIEYWGQSNDLDDIPRGVARAYYRVDAVNTGWSLLEIETNASYQDKIQAYAAGILEGALTWRPIHDHIENTIKAVCDEREKQCGAVEDALERSFTTWKARAAEKSNTDPFWHHVNLYYTQISGIFTGVKHGVERSLNSYETTITDLYWLNAFSDVREIQRKLNISLAETPLAQLAGLSTAFLRVVNRTTEGGAIRQKLFVAHNAVGRYSSMTRILKRYKFNYHVTEDKDSPLASGNSIEFSGYPGSVTSQDEFYVLRGHNHQMAVTGTTLNNYNPKLWKDVNITEQLPVGPRVTAANQLANNVSEWGHMLARYNSGTACNQWLVVDFTRLSQTPSHETGPVRGDAVTEVSVGGVDKDVRHTVMHRARAGRGRGLAWLVEQVPGLTHSADISDALLEQSYWAVNGIPFFQDVANITHVLNMREIYGDRFSFTDSFQARKFQKGHENATSFETIARLMRDYNMSRPRNADPRHKCLQYATYEEKFACVLNATAARPALGARGDIGSEDREAFGVIDTKIVGERANSSDLTIYAISGPLYSEDTGSSQKQTNRGNLMSNIRENRQENPSLHGFEVRNLVKPEKELIQPFQWSKSEFVNETHDGLPDEWAFGPFSPVWSW
ncbi:Putative phospholipase B-like lamina ancestor [Eumeta japonica]|uniref:Phospholipase B-like n=1 Tax=Eumeta variegata TaxID=151549 RepID=A0A4C1U8A3_EUMVA|nr:Putative phospholipase B-like lamina ancestor [Eumeta japonica]